MDLQEFKILTKVEFKRNKFYSVEELKDLFSSVQWKSSEKPEILQEAFIKSSHVIGAYYGTSLLGIVRSMDDSCWSANIDCLIVKPSFQNIGIGSRLLEELLYDLREVRYINVCPDSKEVERFYCKFGFKIINGLYLQKENVV